MATITISTTNISLTSSWKVYENADIGIYYSTPTLASGSRTFDLSVLPRGSIINSAYLNCSRFGSGQVRTMDGMDVTGNQAVAASRITPGGSLTIQFRYRANASGTTVGNKSATAGWQNITLTVDYTAYTAVTAPTSVSLPKDTATPEETLRLSWSGANAGMNNPITGYQVYRADSADGAYTLLDTTANLYLDVTAPATPASYFYKVKAIGTVSGYDSGLSSVYAALAMNVTAPGVPGNPALSQSSQVPGGQVTLSWAASPDGTNNPVTGYAVYTAMAENGQYTFLKNASSASALVEASQAGTVYFKVKAIGTYADSELSSAVALAVDMSTTSDFTLAAQRANAGEALTLTLNGSTASAHTVDVTLRGDASVIREQYTFQGGSDTLTFTPPLSWLAAMTDSAEAPLDIALTTQGGGTIEKTILLCCPDSVCPTVTGAAATPVSSEIPSAWGVYVHGKSKAQLTLNTAASAPYGATIVRYGIQGYGISLEKEALPISGTSDLLAEGSRIFTVYAIDSRGKTGSMQVPVTVEPYAPPSLKNILSVRSDDQGNEDDEGLYALCSAEMVIASCGGHNTATCAVSYRKQGTENWTSAGNLSNGELLIGGALTLPDNWDVRYIVTDALGNSSTWYDLITRAQWELHVKRGGGAWAFGGVADEMGVLKVYGDVKANNITSMGNTLTSHGTRLDVLEAGMVEVRIYTTAVTSPKSSANTRVTITHDLTGYTLIGKVAGLIRGNISSEAREAIAVAISSGTMNSTTQTELGFTSSGSTGRDVYGRLVLFLLKNQA